MSGIRFLIRPAVPTDAAAIAAIYAPYVAETAVSFESAPPDAPEMARRIEATLAGGFPWVVAERSGVVAGYAYAGPFRERAAYAPSAELSVYVAESACRRGIGRALVEAVEDACRARGNANLLACVAAAPEPGDPFLTDASLRFHERLGFAPCARFHACARKFGRWYDTVWLEKRLPPAQEAPPEAWRSLLEQAKGLAVDYLAGLGSKRAFPSADQIAALEEFDEPLPERGTEASTVIGMLNRVGAPATTGQAGGRYFGFVSGGLLPVAHAAAWISDTWNQNGALYAMSPAASRLEEVCERWVCELLGLPPGTAMGLVTGSSNALVCAFAAARDELLRRQGHGVAAKGLRHASRLRVVLGADAHPAVHSALSIVGFGRGDLEIVPVDGLGRMIPEKVPSLDGRTMLVLQAGNVNGGGFDPFELICDMARAAGAWVHVDGAIGLWAACSRRQRHLTRGVEKADSWVTDAHKTLNAGYDCGLVLCRHRRALEDALSSGGVPFSDGTRRDGMRYSTEMSRRTRGVILWAVLKHLGKEGVERLVDGLCDRAAFFAEGLRKAGFEIVNPPQFNQFMVKCKAAAETKRVLRAVQDGGVCWCGGGTWKGEPVIRVSISSHATTRQDVERSVRAFADALERQLPP